MFEMPGHKSLKHYEVYVTWLQYTFVVFREGILQHSFLQKITGMFATRKFFLAQYGMVWDASEYADCEGLLWSKDLLPNAHSPSFSFVRSL